MNFRKGDRVWQLDEGRSKEKLTVEQVWGTRIMAKSDYVFYHDFNEKDLGFLAVEHESVLEDGRV